MKSEMEARAEEVQEKFNTQMKNLTEVLMPSLNKMKEEIITTNMPKSKKDITIDGKPVFASLTTDGRVIITFNSLDDSQKFYDSLKK